MIKMFVHGSFPLCFEEGRREHGKLLPRQSQEPGFRTILLPLASGNTLDLIASPVTAMISSDLLNALGNCLVQVAF